MEAVFLPFNLSLAALFFHSSPKHTVLMRTLEEKKQSPTFYPEHYLFHDRVDSGETSPTNTIKFPFEIHSGPAGTSLRLQLETKVKPNHCESVVWDN